MSENEVVRDCEPCENEVVNKNLFKCECGSTAFVVLRTLDYIGIDNQPPYFESDIQCSKCGKIQSLKRKPYIERFLLDELL